jgi:hypothetical protein
MVQDNKRLIFLYPKHYWVINTGSRNPKHLCCPYQNLWKEMNAFIGMTIGFDKPSDDLQKGMRQQGPVVINRLLKFSFQKLINRQTIKSES